MARHIELERTIGGWYEGVPHLSKNAQRWLTDNIWWLALIGAIMSACGLLVVLPALLTAFSVYHVGAVVVHGSYNSVVSGTSWLSLVVTLAGYVATTILLSLAVPPLKAKREAGWEFLFWSVLVNAILSVMSGLLVYNVYSAVMAIVSAGVAGYLLYEMRGAFVVRATKRTRSRK